MVNSTKSVNITYSQQNLQTATSYFHQKNCIFPVFLLTFSLFHDGGRYDKETSPLICSANQWTGFYMITASVMKELMKRNEYFQKTRKLP